MKKEKLYKCQWEIGDTFAYRLESDLAKDKSLYGQYILISKVDESCYYPGHIIPTVYAKITTNEKLPTSLHEYNKLEYVQVWFSRFEERFFPIDMSKPEEDIAQKKLINYKTDDFGFLPQYRLKLLITSQKSISNKLIYVGNFKNAICPQNEFIPHSIDNIITIPWKQFNETFETKIIKQYCSHNLRELSIYNNKHNGYNK